VDPLAEKYAAWSPYNYVLNNPVGMVDPDGRLVTPPGDYYGYDGKYLRSDNQLDGKVYIYKNANQKEYVTTDVETLKILTVVVQGETTRNANWEQRTGIAEVPRNRAEINGTSIYTESLKPNQFNGIHSTRGIATSTALQNYHGGSDIANSLSGDQKSAAKSAIAALRGSNAAQGATGFDGFGDLKEDYHKVMENVKAGIPTGAGRDRPYRGMDTSRITDPHFVQSGIQSTPNYRNPGSPPTYTLTKVVWDNGQAGVSGTVFYKTN